jgi:hypothetical protein
MSTKSRYFTEIKVESLNQPIDRISRFISEDFDEVVSGQFSSGFLGVGEAICQL